MAFGTPNTKNQSSLGISNPKYFGTLLQYRLKYETVWTVMPKLLLLILFAFLFGPNMSHSLSATQLSLSPLWSPSLSLLPISFSLSFFFSLTLFLSRTHSTSPTSSRCRAADLALSHRPPILPRALSLSLSLSLSVVVAVFLMGVG